MPSWIGSPSTLQNRSLNKVGTPRNGPSGSSRAAAARRVEQRVDDRVELGVDLLDVVDRGVDELERRRVTLANELGLGGGVELGEIGHGLPFLL